MTEQTALDLRLRWGRALLVWLLISLVGWTFLAGIGWAMGIIAPA